jgi:hypothetical protein
MLIEMAEGANANGAKERTGSAALAEPVAPAPPERAEPERDKNDVVLLGPPTEDGAGVHVLRARDERLEAGELRVLEEGRPITGEVVTLAPRKANPRVCDVKESFRPPTGHLARTKTKGPAQVATKAYRDHWEDTFARSGPDADLN